MGGREGMCVIAVVAWIVTPGCKSDDPDQASDTASDTTRGDDPTGADGSEGGSESGGPDLDRATVTHSWGLVTLDPLEEVSPCLQWTLHNEKPLYVNAVTLANDGGFHHSNWFVVPEDYYPGDDGYFNCKLRGFMEIEAALSGTVLTAQSTQSRLETMQLPEGVVVKVPPHHKIMAGGHLLNLASSPYDTELRVSLDIIHPRDVTVVTTPFRLSYTDLEIRAFSESRFSGDCELAGVYESQAFTPLDLKLYYVLPHYHYLGNYFDLTVIGGERDGESVFRLDGFNAAANGGGFAMPIDMTGATGFRFTCGYNNWRDVDIGWGIGDQEMCVMLGLADSAILMDASVSAGQLVAQEDGIRMYEGGCATFGLPKNAAQTMPTPEEIEDALYVPPTDPADVDLPPLDVCVDTPTDAVPALAPTLTNVRDTLFVSTCAFSSCHGHGNPVADLNLVADDLHAQLTTRAVQLSDVAMPLVTPGDPEESWLYHVVSRCDPQDDAGNPRPHMPLNAPELSDPRLISLLRDWIAAGALDD